MAVHVNVSAYALELDLEGRLRGRIEIGMWCETCQESVHLPAGPLSPVSVPFADLDQAVAEHEATRHAPIVRSWGLP